MSRIVNRALQPQDGTSNPRILVAVSRFSLNSVGRLIDGEMPHAKRLSWASKPLLPIPQTKVQPKAPDTSPYRPPDNYRQRPWPSHRRLVITLKHRQRPAQRRDRAKGNSVHCRCRKPARAPKQRKNTRNIARRRNEGIVRN